MSPTEDQLRAALSDGEGPGPDADSIIGAALRIRKDRRDLRVRLAGAALGVAILGGISVQLTRGSGDDNQKASDSQQRAGAAGKVAEPAAPEARASSAAGGATVAGGVINGAGSGGGAASAGGPYAADTTTGVTGCPSTPVSYLVPSGTSSALSTSAPLFSAQVKSFTVCIYSPDSNALQSAQRLDDGAATTFADALEAGKSSPAAPACLTPVNLELLPTSTLGTALKSVTVIGTCQQIVVTNGTAVRYLPISELSAAGLTLPASAPSSGIMSGGNPPR